MSSPLDDVLAGFSRRYRKKARKVEPLIQKYLDEGMTPAQAVDKALKETDFKAYMTKAVKDAMLSSAVIGAGSYTAGKSTPLDEAWDPSGMTLSEKLHGTSKAMRNHIINTIKEQLKQGAHAMKSARALYDGYNTTDNVVRKQMLPKYLQDVVNFSRRSDLTKNDVIALQKLVRKARRMVDRLAQNGAPNRALKTSYKELLDAVESCSDKALKRAIRTAVEEKSRYVAERIARTESARAWYQGFLKDTMDDPDVVAYRWVESTRHPTEDICDEYAKVDAYGLGPGIFPKDKAPELPAHPHCLCHYEKVYASERKGIDKNKPVKKHTQGQILPSTPNFPAGVNYVCELNPKIYKNVTVDIRRNAVIITDKQIQHIKDRHPGCYKIIESNFAEIIQEPDYLIEGNKPNRCAILKELTKDKLKVKVILQIQTSAEPKEFENSIITGMRISSKEWGKILRNKKVLYNRLNSGSEKIKI